VREIVWRGEEKNSEEIYETQQRYLFSSLKKGKVKPKQRENSTKEKCQFFNKVPKALFSL